MPSNTWRVGGRSYRAIFRSCGKCSTRATPSWRPRKTQPPGISPCVHSPRIRGAGKRWRPAPDRPPEGGSRLTGWLRRPEARWGLAVAAFGLIERWLVGRFYQPISYGDTAPYLRLANDLLTRGLGGYDGTRVPGYPIFLLLLRMDPSRVWA